MTSPAPPRVLVVCWTPPPTLTGTAFVIGNLARQFSREEMLIVGERPAARLPLEWGEELPRVRFVQWVWPFTGRGLKWWRFLQAPLMFLLVLWHALRFRPAAVLAVFPNALFLAAGRLAAKVTGARLLPYFHNTYVENRRGASLGFARCLQGRVFGEAAHVFVMSEGMAELYRERYPDLACSALTHSFNGPIPELAEPPAPSSPLQLAMFGNINDSCLDASVRVAEAVGTIPDARLEVLSSMSPAYLRRIGLLREHVTHETVPDAQVAARLAAADILVLPHGLTGSIAAEEYRTIFPTKTIPCLLAGRPILAHATRGSFIARFLAENDCALVVDRPDVEALAAAMERLRTDRELRVRLVRNALATAARFHASRVAAQLRRHLL
jgi:glycosyltransferase involved in cell wall biosynthesis